MIFVFLSKVMNNDEQSKEREMSFYTFIFEEVNKELKKNDVKEKKEY